MHVCSLVEPHRLASKNIRSRSCYPQKRALFAMTSFINTELQETDWGHPDSAIRLATAVHRFPTPLIRDKANFQRSFKTVGTHAFTKPKILRADATRNDLKEALEAKRPLPEQVIHAAEEYLPLIQQILVTCKFQPESARLDKMLVFEWCSGVEPETALSSEDKKKKSKKGIKKERKVYKSEALMYDMVMTIATIALGRGWAACDASASGDFKVASQNFCKAAGIMEYLETDALPQWNARGTVSQESLPSEIVVGTCKGLKLLFLIQAQQMAVATILIKPGTPNYGLLAKLCLSITEKVEEFVNIMRKEAFPQMNKMDTEFFTLLTFHIYYQRSLALYFQARQKWDEGQYGMGIALLSEAAQELKFRDSSTSVGLPDVSKTQTLHMLDKDLKDFQTHLKKLLKYWEDDNSSVYFDRVPPKVAAQDKLQKGHFIGKTVPFALLSEDVQPLPLTLPDHVIQRSDSDLARQLEKQLNM